MMLISRCDEGLNRCASSIVSHHPRDSVEEDRFPVCASTVEEKQRVLVCDAGQGVATHALHELLQFSISLCNSSQKLQPQGTRFRLRSNSGHLCAVILALG